MAKIKTGRPQKEIDEKVVRKLCEIQCTDLEIAAFFEVDVSTIERRFAGQLYGWRYFGHSSLRRAQWKKGVEDGDTVMLKHLGKVFLKQGDEPTASSQQPYFKAFVDEINKNASKPIPE